MTHPHHHKHIRKRIHKHKEPYPSPVPWKRMLDVLLSVLGIGATFAVLPQLFQIWNSRSAENISLFTWSYFLLYVIVMLAYGIVHKEKPIVVIYGSQIAVYVLIVTGIIIYR